MARNQSSQPTGLPAASQDRVKTIVRPDTPTRAPGRTLDRRRIPETLDTHDPPSRTSPLGQPQSSGR
jgi:hypothetical protein